MTDPCSLRSCREPREHGTPYCEAHWSLVPNKLKTNFQFVLGRWLKAIGTPREAATTQDFKAVLQTVDETIREALEAHKELE